MPGPEASDRRGPVSAVRARLRNRRWPIAVTLVMVVTAMAFNLFWGVVVRHHDYWVEPGDIWGAYRSAHYIGWGSLGSVYAVGTALVTFPGILLLFTPVAMITASLGLSESFPYYIPHPTAWFVLGPYEILIGCTAIFACDALAQRLGVSGARRIALCFAEGVVLWPMLAFWGHPEDALGLALAIYALVFALDDRWTGGGWLFGAAVATQPLVLLMLPVLMARAGKQRVLALGARSILPAVALLAAPLLAEFHTTFHALFAQPNYPRIDHATPWTWLAPRVGGTGKNVMVAAGPGRVVALVAAGGLGWWARRWRDRPDLIVWAAAAALALRCLTESVMVAFYVWPTLALGLVAVVRRADWRVVLGTAAAIGVTVSSETSFGEWVWWGLANGGLLVVLLSGLPRPSRVADEVPINLNTTGTERPFEPSHVLVGAIR